MTPSQRPELSSKLRSIMALGLDLGWLRSSSAVPGLRKTVPLEMPGRGGESRTH